MTAMREDGRRGSGEGVAAAGAVRARLPPERQGCDQRRLGSAPGRVRAFRACQGVVRHRSLRRQLGGTQASVASNSWSARAAWSGSHNKAHLVSPSAVAASLAMTAAYRWAAVLPFRL